MIEGNIAQALRVSTWLCVATAITVSIFVSCSRHEFENPSDEGVTGEGGGNGGAVCTIGDDCRQPTPDCADAPAPKIPSSQSPVRGAYTGSLHAPAEKRTLRPEVSYGSVEAGCGALRYEVQFDDSCQPGELESCAFESPEDSGSSSTDTYRPAKDLPVSTAAPVGRFYAWRVRACNGGTRCSDWASPAWLHVGRTREDVNGDGYADVLAGSNLGSQVYWGGKNFNGTSDARITTSAIARFVGDLNGDGFADVGRVVSAYADCTIGGPAIEIVYGAADLTEAVRQVLCRTAGSASVSVMPSQGGDLNGDGFDDLAVAWGYGATENSLLLFAGGTEVSGETFREADATNGGVNYVLTPGTQVVAGGGDYNGDGFADLVAAAYGTASDPARFLVLLGGAGTEPTFDIDLVDSVCRTIRWLSDPADMDGDGKGDWAVVCDGAISGESHFAVLYGGSTAGEPLQEVWTTEIALRSATSWLDFDGDGTNEYLLGVEAENPVIWRPSSSDVVDPERYTRLFFGSAFDVADHNGDGRVDVVAGSSANVARAGASTSFNVVATSLLPSDDTNGNLSLGF